MIPKTNHKINKSTPLKDHSKKKEKFHPQESKSPINHFKKINPISLTAVKQMQYQTVAEIIKVTKKIVTPKE